MKGDEQGWWDVTSRDKWRCPNCMLDTSPIEWEKCEVYCEDCGEHEGRRCPACGESFDHVWGAIKIEDESKKIIGA